MALIGILIDSAYILKIEFFLAVQRAHGMERISNNYLKKNKECTKEDL